MNLSNVRWFSSGKPLKREKRQDLFQKIIV